MTSGAGPVVVGIDGSTAAIRTAEWATDEAVIRNVPLRLVHVTHIEESPTSPADDFRLEVEYAETALRAASAAVERTGKTVKVDTSVRTGHVDAVLIEETRDASMICVGSVGIGRLASKVLGSTAVGLAEHAHCPVAIIRTDPDEPPQEGGWIAVVIDDAPDNDAVVCQAMEEGRLRNAPVLALGASRLELGELQ